MIWHILIFVSLIFFPTISLSSSIDDRPEGMPDEVLSDSSVAESEAIVAKIYNEKLAEFQKYNKVKSFLGVPKYANSQFLLERSAAMTSENMGKDIFVCSSMDDSVAVAYYYGTLEGAKLIDNDDGLYVFGFTVNSKNVSVAITGTMAGGKVRPLSEITIMEMDE